METAYRLASHDSATDVKELIPEFFFLPEFLVNNENFNFGERQNGKLVHHVTLPPWSGNDSRLFIFIHRQALESFQVSQNLHHWIDLVLFSQLCLFNTLSNSLLDIMLQTIRQKPLVRIVFM